jgi:hypothetical protein
MIIGDCLKHDYLIKQGKVSIDEVEYMDAEVDTFSPSVRTVLCKLTLVKIQYGTLDKFEMLDMII